MKNIKNIEIELFSYCNRKCLWCPNQIIDRNINKEIDIEIFEKIIQELKENNYKGNIILSRYNEPFSYIKNLKERVNYIRSNLDANIIVNTNGDYLSKINITNLNIDQLLVMDYDNIGLEKCIKKLIDIGAKTIEINNDYIYANFKNIKIYYYYNWKEKNTIYNCGGYLPQYNNQIRTFPCYEPNTFIGINYDGTISPCPNIRNDIKDHQSYILGDLHNNTLTEIINSEKAISFKTKCENGIFNPKSICYYCLYQHKE